MKQWITVVLFLVSLVSAPGRAADFTLTSTDIQAGKRLPEAQVANIFGCEGGNRSPQLSWHHAPAGTKSFAITAYDPDAPTGSGWWHWVVFDIPATVASLAANAGDAKAGLLPAPTIQSHTDSGTAGYSGACPPPGHGLHRYQFTVYALKVPSLHLDADASAAMVGFMVNANSLGKARLEAVYQR